MEAISAVNVPAKIRQHKSISVKHSSLEVCKNIDDMPFKDLLASITKKLMSYALMLTNNDEDDAWDLIQSTIEKLIKNREKLQASNQPVAYAKRILKNNFIDNYRKEKRMISIEANDIEIINEGLQEASVELLKPLANYCTYFGSSSKYRGNIEIMNQSSKALLGKNSLQFELKCVI